MHLYFSGLLSATKPKIPICMQYVNLLVLSKLALVYTNSIYLSFSVMQSVVKQNLHSESEADINKLTNLKLTASYTYLALVHFLCQFLHNQ